MGLNLAMFISVIICTHNRCSLLKEALASLGTQSFPTRRFEIIVIDNNSTDDTRQVVESFAEGSPVPVSWVFEDKPGLSHARNAGICHARGEIIAFMDDDAAAGPGWVSALSRAFDDPATAAAGGPVRPIWGAPRPAWLADKWAPYLSIEEFAGMNDGDEFPSSSAPIGTNMAFRRSRLGDDIRFPASLGRRGESLVSNEELHVCRRLREQGGRIRFAADAAVLHRIPPERLRKEWLYRRVYWQGRSDVLMSEPPLAEAALSCLVCVGVMAKNSVQSLLADETGAFSARMMVALYRGRLDGLVQRMAGAGGAP